MTVEEIKEAVTMPELLSKYGIRVNRNGFCNCPFHNEKTASMKVYPKSAYCFGCGWGGDVIKFVQAYNRCDFKTAFYELGGHYENTSEKEREQTRQRFKRERERRERIAKAQGDFKRELGFCMAICRAMIDYLEPMCDRWVFYQNKLPCLVGAWEEKFIHGEEVNEIDVLRMCREVRRDFRSFARSDGRIVRD